MNTNKFTFTFVSSGDIAGSFPSRKQINFPVCSYIIREMIMRRFHFLQSLMRGEISKLEEEIHESANGKFWEAHRKNLMMNARSDINNARIDIFNENEVSNTRESVFWGFTKFFSAGCIPISLGGLPELRRAEILEKLEKEAFQVGNLIAITRASHSFMFIVVSTGLFLLYDSAQSNIYLLSRNGIFQHIFLHDFVYSQNENEFEPFNTQDFFMAYRNFYSDDWDFSPLMEKIYGKKDDKEEKTTEEKIEFVLI